MKTTRKTQALLTALFALGTLTPLMAETVPTNERGTVNVNYFDDNAQKVPVVGSTFKLLKIADIVSETVEGTSDGLRIESLIDGLTVTRKTTTDDVIKHLKLTSNNESDLDVSDTAKDGTKLDVYEGKTASNGTVTFEDLPFGVYFGIETEAARYHVRSTPFLISVPNTNEDGTLSSLKAEIFPKSAIAGDLVITKKLVGDDTEKDRDWTFEVSLPEGVYAWESSEGDDGTIEDGGELKIKGDESVTIYNLPSEAKYEVVEQEANADGYETSYNNEEGEIEAKDEQEVVVTNERNMDYDPIDTMAFWQDMSEDPMNLLWISIPVVGVIALIIIFIAIKRRKRRNN